jgi:hypothetical protein
MAEETVQQIYNREAPEFEALKLNLLQQARDLAFNIQRDPTTGEIIGTTTPLSQQLPGYQVAGFSPAQLAAMGAAEGLGVGSYMPYIQAGAEGVGAGITTTGEAANILRGADTRAQFTDAQRAMQNAALAGQGITSGVEQLGVGLGYLDEAARRAAMSDVSGRLGGAYQDVETGLGALATAQNMAALASQADVRPATAAIGQGLSGLTGAQELALGTAGADFAGSQALLGEAARRAGVTPDMLAAQQTIYGGLGQGQQAIAMAQQAAAQPAIQQGIGALFQGAESGLAATQQPGFERGVSAVYSGAAQGARSTGQPGFAQGQTALARGIGAIGGAARGFQPGATQAFMDPYRQQVIDETIRQINRQGQLAQQALSAQAVRAGAFGGEREAVQRAELERNLQEQRSSTIANLLSQGYTQAQASAMAAFEQQQQRQMAAGQGIGQLGAQQAAIAAQQAGLGLQAAGLQQQAGQADIAAAAQRAGFGQQAAQMLQQAGTGAIGAGVQQGQLQQQAAQIAAQQAALGVQAGSEIGALSAQQAQLGQAGAGLMANIGQTVGQQAAQQAQLGQAAAGLFGNLAQQQIAAGQGLGQLGVQQAQLGQSAADIYNRSAQTYGNLAAQTGALAGQESSMQQNIANLLAAQAAQRGQVASTAANIYGQQANTFQNLGQGIGGLAAQQFGIGQNIASGLGALGGQLGQLGVQQAALGQTAQALNQGDINFLYNVGQAQQALAQQGIDAQRATQLQQIYAPYQQIGFLSDIYRGAPSTQMSTQVMSQPSASPFQQAVGIGLGAVGTLAGAKKAGII